jgi:glycosyltransferase involved in cell wall biosynthesis
MRRFKLSLQQLMNSEKIVNQSIPLVSIIALCYNHERFLLDTLTSIKNQTYPSLQLIIADDASADNSVEKINQWISSNNMDASFIRHKENEGICRTINEALTYCKGKYTQLIACDDIMIPEKTEIMVSALENAGHEYALIYSDMYVIDENNHLLAESLLSSIGRDPDKMPEGNVFLEELKGNFILAPSVIMRTEVIRELGGYDEELLFEDYDMFLRIAKDYKIKYLGNKKTVFYRRLDSSVSISSGSRIYENVLITLYKTLAIEADPVIRGNIIESIRLTTFKLAGSRNSERKKWVKKLLSFSYSIETFGLYLYIISGLKKSGEDLSWLNKAVNRKIQKWVNR